MADGLKGSIADSTRSTDIKVLSDIPATRIASVFLLFMGGVLGICPLLASNRDEIGLPGLAAFVLIGAALAVAGIVLGNWVKRVDVFFDRVGNRLYVNQKGWFQTQALSTGYDVASIKSIDTIEKSDSDGDVTYQLQLVFKDGTRLALSNAWVYGRTRIDAEAGKLNDIVQNGANNLNKLIEEDRKQTRIPLPFWCVIGLVLMLPFASDWYAHTQPLPRVEIQTGVPSPELVERVRQISHNTLPLEGEVLWVGQPELGRESAVKGPWVIPFAIVWTLFSLAWVSIAAAAAWQSRPNPLPWLMPLFGVPFVVIGFGLLLLPYFSYKSDLQTVYVLTDKAAYRIIDGTARKFVSYKERDFGPIEIKSYASSRADVMFVRNSSEGDKHPYGGFYGIKDFQTVADLLKGQQASQRQRLNH